MSKEKELFKLMEENPDLEVIVFYPEESSDHYYTVGKIVKVSEDYTYNDGEQTWLKNYNHDQLVEDFADSLFDELFPDKRVLSDEEDEILVNKAIEKIKGLDWKKSIVVWVNPK